MVIDFPPGLILVLGAFILPFTRGPLRSLVSVVLPALTLMAIWTAVPEGHIVTLPFLDGLSLTPLTWHPLGTEAIGPEGFAPPSATRVFATIFALMATVGALFSLKQDDPTELPGAFVYAGSAICVTFAGDILSLFVFWELMALGSTLVVWSGKFKGTPKAGMRYVCVHLVGGVILMAGILAHAMPLIHDPAVLDPLALHHYAMGPLGFDGMTLSLGSADVSGLGTWLILIGILVNAGAPPLGAWLPDAYPEASPFGTVFLSAFTTKTAVYVLLVLFAGAELLIYIGCIMAVYGIVYAILENDMRRILAYSIINQVGFMICGIGIGTQLALNGASAHAFAHIIYKALLLMSAGSVLYMTGKRKCTDLGGLYHTMPVTMWCGIIGALAISAFPFTSGFTTKSMITDAASHEHLAMAWYVLMAASAGVFLHAGIKFPWFVFFQKDRGLRPKDPPISMQAAMVIFAFFCILLGVYPDPLYNILPYQVPIPEGQNLYQAMTGAPVYSVSHVVAQLQLLMFSGLAFFLLLPMLKRTLTITLDSDWFYRKLVPGLWKHIIFPPIKILGLLYHGFLEDMPKWLATIVRINPDGKRFDLFRSWTLGAAMVLTTLMLFVYLVYGFTQ